MDYLALFDRIQYIASGQAILAGVTSPPIDLNIWCNDNAEIDAFPFDFKGICDGLLRYRNEKFNLFYDINPYKMRFNFAHELAHYLIDDHYELIKYGKDELYCTTGFIDSAIMELEADLFGAALLMPDYLFLEYSPDPSFEKVTELANLFNVSFTSAALRVVQLCPVPTSLIVCKDSLIKWGWCSEEMFFKNINKVKVDTSPPKSSKTYEIQKRINSYSSTPVKGRKTYSSDWFINYSTDPPLWEEVVPLPNQGMTLTFLSLL